LLVLLRRELHLIHCRSRLAQQLVEISGFTYGEIVQLNDEQGWEIYANTAVIFENMETTYEKLLVIEDWVVIIEDWVVIIEDLVDATKASGFTKYAGCNSKDDDEDDSYDECDEDRYPPELVLPLDADEFQRTGLTVKIIGKTFETIDEAMLYLESVVGVVDDCAPSKDLRVEVAYDANIMNTCGPLLFTATPVDSFSRDNNPKNKCGEASGTEYKFTVTVNNKTTSFCHDNYPPEVVLPMEVDVLSLNSAGFVRILGKTFETSEEAIAYLYSAVGVRDDCAPASDLSLFIEQVEGTSCANSTFTVTPKHDTGCTGVVSGPSQNFLVTVNEKPKAFCHDNYPPAIVLPTYTEFRRTDNVVTILNESFKTVNEAIAFLYSILGVSDDCAPQSDLDLVITRNAAVGDCEDTTFMVTPTHDTGCTGIVSGETVIFKVKVDGDAPVVSCSLNFEASRGRSDRYLDSSGTFLLMRSATSIRLANTIFGTTVQVS
jgi:hypothetical protein